MKKLIETALPLSFLKKIAPEKAGAGNPANLHMWWGRTPYDLSLFALAAAVVDASEHQEELLQQLKRVQNQEYTELGEKPTVFDPFSGCGGIPLAAQRLGFPAVAGDLNPVAVMLTKAVAEIPAAFANCPPVNPSAQEMDGMGAAGLAEDVQYYGEWLREQAFEKLKSLYPSEPEGVSAAWLWARTVKCPNPACGCTMSLASSFVLSRREGRDIWAEPVIKDGKLRFEVKSGKCPKEKETNKHGRRGAIFSCPVCGSLTSDEYMKSQGAQHQIGAQLMAVAVETSTGRVIRSPSERQENAANILRPEDIPKGEIPNNAHWFSPPGFGMKEYADLFSPRQLTMLTTFCDLLAEVQSKAASDALAAGMAHDGGGLSNGGRGALAYGQAVSIYLAFAIDKLADSNSTICSWRTTTGNIRNTFGRQAIPMVWSFAEGNPFSHISGNFHSALKTIVTAMKALPCGSAVSTYQGDAVTEPYPKNVLVCTEFPYYKAIGYAHLSDFFYIWMRRSLKPVFPELFNQMVTSKEELSTVGQFYGQNQKECNRSYEGKMLAVLKKLYVSATPDYPALLFYEYHRADDRSVKSFEHSGQEPTAWEIMLDNIVRAGFTICAVWPMHTGAMAKNADGIRVLIVARKKKKAKQITRRSFIQTLKHELPDRLETLVSVSGDDAEKELPAMGCGLSIFTRYEKVINADGSNTNIQDALRIIYQEIAESRKPNTDDGSTEYSVAKED